MGKSKLYRFVLLLSLAGFGWLFLNRAGLEWLPGGCLFHSITRIPCPACGSTRAVLCVLNGNLTEAFLINPLGIFTTLSFITFSIWICLDIVLRKDSFYRFYKKSEVTIRRKRVYFPLIFLIVINWLWNISKNL